MAADILTGNLQFVKVVKTSNDAQQLFLIVKHLQTIRFDTVFQFSISTVLKLI